MTIYVLPTKRENSSMNHRTRCMMGTLPLRGTFSQSQKLKRCGGFFFDVFGVVMTVYMNWKKYSCTDVMKKKVKNQTN